MQDWEINNIIENIENVDRLAWEQTRLLMYMTAQVNSTKKLKVNDIIKFPWEEKKVEKPKLRKDITQDEINELSKKALMIQQKYL